MTADRLWLWVLASLALHALAVGVARQAAAPAAASPRPLSLAVELVAPAQRHGVHAAAEQPPEEPGPRPRAAAPQPPAPPAPAAEHREPKARQPVQAVATRAEALQPPTENRATTEPESIAAAAPASAVAQEAQRPGAQSAPREAIRAELSRLLHLAIAARQHYPLSARRMRREGTARIGFWLHPDGRLSALELTRSTGHAALDQAALRAVEAIQPFAPAAEFLASAEEFQVDIIFRIGNR